MGLSFWKTICIFINIEIELPYHPVILLTNYARCYPGVSQNHLQDGSGGPLQQEAQAVSNFSSTTEPSITKNGLVLPK